MQRVVGRSCKLVRDDSSVCAREPARSRGRRVRDRSGVEVDIILERPDGSVVAIEVKSARSVNKRDASGLTFLRDRLGDRFQCGILFHTGPLTARLGERVWAVPVAALWNGSA